MKSWIVALVVALIPVGAVAFGAFQDEEKTPNTETIMKGLFSKKAGKFGTVKKQFEAAKPEWDKIQETTEEINKLGKALGKNDPEKGSKESWKKLSDKFAENTKALDDAADEKDLKKLKDAHSALQKTCKACHDVHKGQ